MVDLRPYLFNLLKTIAPVKLEFPDTKAAFPVITITEVANTSNYIIDGREAVTDATYQIDVWDNGPNIAECERISTEVNNALVANYFNRVMGRGFRDPSGLWRKTMYFNTKAINKI